MTIGSFSPFLGTLGDDPLFDSFFAEDNNNNLLARNLDIIYGLQGNDNLALNSNLTADNTSILVGGSGNDQYLIENNKFAVILDNGNSDSDTVVATGISNATNQFLTIDNRHLYVFDLTTDTYLLFLDYRESENKIEFFDTADGTFTYTEVITEIDNAIASNNPSFIGDFTFSQAQTNSDIPEDARLDLESIGLSVDTVNTDIQEIKDTANNFENTILFTDDSVDGSLSNGDNFYIYNGERYFYDFYSIDSGSFDSGDIVNINLTSDEFDPLLLVLDSRGNVLEFSNDSGDSNSSELAFIVASGEPIFVAVESVGATQTGNYNITFDTVNVDISDINRNDSNLGDRAVFGIDTIQTTDSLTGSLTSDDVQSIDGNDVFFQDGILLTEGTVGQQVQVSLNSDFDGELFIQAFDAAGMDIDVIDINTNELIDGNRVAGAGIEQGTFTIEDNLDYVITVQGVNPNTIGDYTLTTELI